MTTLETAARPHACHPGWEYRWHDGDGDRPAGNYAHDLHLPAGSVWQCDGCGQVWVADDAPDTIGNCTWLGRVKWRKERWRERRRRLRAATP